MLHEKVKDLFKRNAWIINRIPFINRFRIKGKHNILTLNKPMIKCKIVIKGSGNEVVMQSGGGMSHCNIYIEGNNNKIFIGPECSIVQGILYMEDDENCISIGKNTKICGRTLLACIETTSIEIESECLLSSDIDFRTGDSHSILDINGNRINHSKSIHIGKHVWIGNGVKILKGVKIPQDCIIGTGALVTKTIEESAVIIAGNPAGIVKRNIDWETERK